MLAKNLKILKKVLKKTLDKPPNEWYNIDKIKKGDNDHDN